MKIKKGKYRHYKGKCYQVLDCVRHSEDESLLVLYKPLYGEQDLWVRPYEMFFEHIEIEGRRVERFAFISDM